MKNTIANFYNFTGSRATKFGFAGFVFAFFAFVCDLAMAIMLQRFFMAAGLVSLGKDMPLGVALNTATTEGIILIVVAIIRGFITWGSGYVASLCQVVIEVEKRQQLTQWSISKDGQEVGTIMSYFNDIILGSAAAIGGIFYIASRVILMVGVFGTMFYYSYSMSAFVIVILFIIAPIQILIDKAINKNSKIIQSSMANSVSLLSRAIKNNLFISLHNLSSHETKTINHSLESYGSASASYYVLNNIRAIFPQIMGIITVVFIAIKGNVFFEENPATLVLFLYMVLRFFQILSDIARVSGNLRLNYPRIFLLYQWWKDNILNTHANESWVIDDKNYKNNHIGWRGDNISFTWPNSKDTNIQNLSFDIPPLSTTLIVGASGSGKTTFFNILLGLLKPTKGALNIYDLEKNSNHVINRIPYKISYVGSDPFIISGTIRDQLLMGNLNINDDEIKTVLNLVDGGFVFDFQDGLDHTLSEQGHGLSAGQKQRIALARAILRKPSILLLDEATANLDAKTERVIVNFINSMHKKMSIFIISHRPNDHLIIDKMIDFNEKSSHKGISP